MELSFLLWIQETLQCGFTDWFFPTVTTLGDKGLIWLTIPAAAPCAALHRLTGAAGFYSVFLYRKRLRPDIYIIIMQYAKINVHLPQLFCAYSVNVSENISVSPGELFLLFRHNAARRS